MYGCMSMAAFGLWAAASSKTKNLVKGIELADSWATDAHKWLNVPYDCGLVFVKEQESLVRCCCRHGCLPAGNK